MTASYQPAASTAPLTGSLAAESRITVDEALLTRARTLGPTIREHADAAERERRLSRPVVDAMRDAGFFRMFAPRAFGGSESDPVTVARVAEELATHDAAAAWALQAGNTGAWWMSRFPDAASKEVFADGPDLMMAASFSPPHRAEVVPGGYRFTGRGPLASTVHDSPWVMMSGIVFDGDQPRMTPMGPAIVGLLMHTNEVEIVDTWHSLGMRGTDSNDVAADGVFVPDSRSAMLSPHVELRPPFTGPLYAIPAPVATYVVIAPTALAIARGAITELRELADRKTPLGSMKTIRHRAAVQSALAEAEAMLRAARLLLYETLDELWHRTRAGATTSLEQKADVMLAAAYAVRTASKVTDLVHRMAGTSGVYARNRLERHFRDAQTVRHHGFMSESRFETVGQVYLGLEPEFPFVVF